MPERRRRSAKQRVLPSSIKYGLPLSIQILTRSILLAWCHTFKFMQSICFMIAVASSTIME